MSETITVELGKDDVIRMICGSAIPPKGIPLITKLCGNRHNQYFSWDTVELEQMAIGELMQIYALINWQEPPKVEAPRIVVATA